MDVKLDACINSLTRSCDTPVSICMNCWRLALAALVASVVLPSSPLLMFVPEFDRDGLNCDDAACIVGCCCSCDCCSCC